MILNKDKTTNCRVSFIDLYLVFPTNFRILFLPQTNTIILLELNLVPRGHNPFGQRRGITKGTLGTRLYQNCTVTLSQSLGYL